MSCTVDWELVKQKREKLALLSNGRENSKRLHHEYKINYQILIVLDRVEQGGKLSCNTEGPYFITKVYDNGTGFWDKLTKLGFKVNEYERCVTNKVINGE